MNVRDDSSSCDGSSDKVVKFLISSDGQLEMSRGDSLDFKILTGISSEFKNLSSEVLQNSSRVNSSGRPDSVFCTYMPFE